MTLLGKMIFPGQAPWQQRKKLHTLLWALTAGLLMGGLIAGFAYLQIHKH